MEDFAALNHTEHPKVSSESCSALSLRAGSFLEVQKREGLGLVRLWFIVPEISQISYDVGCD